MPWKGENTTVGLFQTIYQGSPVSSYIDLYGALTSEPYEATYVFGRGQYVSMAQNSSTGAITLGTPYARRTPWYVQSDINAAQQFKVGDHQAISIEATALNAFNQRAVTAYWAGMDSLNFATPIYPGGQNLYTGAALYQAAEGGYNVQSLMSSDGVIAHSQYGQPYLTQQGRSIRLGVRFTF